MASAPGWYPDPDGKGGQRYFDGTNWGPQAPTTTTPPPSPQKKRPGCFKTVLGLIGVIFLIGFVSSQCNSKDSTTSSSSSSSSRTSSSPETSVTFSKTFTPSAVAPTTTEPEKPSFTPGQQNAIAKAESYLNYTSFSKQGLIDQLKFDDFSVADATFAVENVEANGGVDWNEQAVKKAKSYLDYTSFSKSGLIEQLESDDFTPSQAEYGVNAAYGG